MKMKTNILWAVLLAWMLPAFGQEARNVASFDAGWLFQRYGLQADGSRVEEPVPAPDSQTFDDADWRKLDLPHDWGIEGPFRQDLDGFTGKLPWRGIGWYRKHFHVPASDRGKMVYLDFDGAMANAEVWLNGQKIGERPYGYISFRVDLTPALRFGQENILAVRLNTERWGSRWYPGAGLYRHVRMVKTHPVHIGQWGVFVTTPQITSKTAVTSIRVEIDNRLSRQEPGHLYGESAQAESGRKGRQGTGAIRAAPPGGCPAAPDMRQPDFKHAPSRTVGYRKSPIIRGPNLRLQCQQYTD